jgi:hypothetical protein
VRQPPPDFIQQVEQGLVGTPRAAFGLPIQVQFIDNNDKRASAMILPLGAQRWPSPLLLRPLRLANGGYLPAAVLLPIPVPEKIEVRYDRDKEKPRSCAVKKSVGAQPPIAKLLRAADGRALEAFAEWLVSKYLYRRVARP